MMWKHRLSHVTGKVWGNTLISFFADCMDYMNTAIQPNLAQIGRAKGSKILLLAPLKLFKKCVPIIQAMNHESWNKMDVKKNK